MAVKMLSLRPLTTVTTPLFYTISTIPQVSPFRLLTLQPAAMPDVIYEEPDADKAANNTAEAVAPPTDAEEPTTDATAHTAAGDDKRDTKAALEVSGRAKSQGRSSAKKNACCTIS